MIALDFSVFLGRFHPLLVHLPIGFLILALLMEWIQNKKQAGTWKHIISLTWMLGAISAIIAALCGWLLANTGIYPENELFWHRCLGISLAIIASLGWFIKKEPNKYKKSIRNSISFLVMTLLLLEGHLGGNITHGAGYLAEYAPKPLNQLFFTSTQHNSAPDLSQKDSVLVFENMVLPILESKCFACHNDETQRGGLNMEDITLLFDGGENGPIINSGIPLESELFKRVTLPSKNSKFMPPRGEPLTYDEIQVIEWWIDQGAEINKLISDLTVTEKIKPVVKRVYKLDLEPKPWYETVSLKQVDSLLLNNLRDEGFIIKSLGSENSFLDIAFTGNSLNIEKLSKLLDVKEYITWLSLAGTNVEDEWVSVISEFPNLTRLELQKTSVSDDSVQFLRELEHLESLNLYGTNVTDSCLSVIRDFPELKRVYLWNSKVSFDRARALQEGNPDLEVEIGVSFK